MNLKEIFRENGITIIILVFSFIWAVGTVYQMVQNDVPTYGIEKNVLYWLVYWPMIAIVLYLQTSGRTKDILGR